MFTGIIENLGTVVGISDEQGNRHFTIKSTFTSELKIDQSIAHNGVCLTVVDISEDTYTVTAIQETLEKSNFDQCKIGDILNLERAMILGARLDGHIVQGHVDQTAVCTDIKQEDGSWIFTFSYEKSPNVTIEKGSITVNGVSLTVVNSQENSFSAAIIPYTFEHTNFHKIKKGSSVNLEFDVIGKYVTRLLQK